MSEQLELLTENSSQWTTVTYVTPEIQKKEIKPFVVLAIKELEGNPDSRTSSLMNADKFAAVRAVVRHLARSRSATKQPWAHSDVITFLEGLRFSPECVAELASLVCVDKIYENIPTHLRMKSKLVSMQWKIDLSMSQPHASPRVLLWLRLADGRVCAARLRRAGAERLRLAAAHALRALLRAEARPRLRD